MTSILSSTTPSAREALAIQLRNRWELVQARWIALPDSLRRAWTQVGERLRSALDVPTKAELESLSDKLDELDARLAALVEQRAGKPRSRSTKTRRSAKPVADRRVRKRAR